MGYHPINLAVRFLLEIVAVYAVWQWGWNNHTGAEKIILGILLPIFLMAIWAIFRAREPQQPGHSIVKVPGIIRLLLEGIVLGTAIWAFVASGKSEWAIYFGIVTILHYILSYDRVISLIRGET